MYLTVKDIDDDSWMEQGNCRTRRDLPRNLMHYDTDERFEGKNKSHEYQAIKRQALLVCMDCPVRTHCLLYAFRNKYVCSMWGGIPPAGRKVIRKTPIMRALEEGADFEIVGEAVVINKITNRKINA